VFQPWEKKTGSQARLFLLLFIKREKHAAETRQAVKAVFAQTKTCGCQNVPNGFAAVLFMKFLLFGQFF
jgi:hypothetical protein